MVELSRRRYPNNYDIETAERWVRNNVLCNPLTYYAVRTDKAFLIAFVTVLPWLPADGEVSVLTLCAEEEAGWDPIRLCRASIDWARKRNAAVWRINSETSYDLKMIAHRVGARDVSERYVLNLRG